jgi:hypothetical protein
MGGGGSGVQRALTAADMGLEGTDAVVTGTFRVSNGER